MTTQENTPPDLADDMVRATLHGRVCTAGLVLCLMALAAFFQLFVLPLLSTLAENPSSQDIRMLKWILTGFAVSGILPALYMIATGRKVRSSTRYPLAGAWVLRDTKVKRGTEALRIGAFCIISGVIACMICVSTLAYIWIMSNRLTPEHTLPQGVIILEQGTGIRP